VWCLVAVGLLLVTGGGVFWVWKIEPIRQHHEFVRRVNHQVEALAKRRPPNVTPRQWENVVAWTSNAVGNCLSYEPNLSAAERQRFEAEWTRRLEGPIDLATIDWFWDELVRLTKHGPQYSENWRPTTPERLQEFDDQGIDWAGFAERG